MKTFIAFICAFSALVSISHTQAQAVDARVLWTYTLRSGATQDFYKHGCATTKTRPFNVEMCFSEKFRRNLDQPIEAYVKYYSNGRVETYRITAVSRWNFLYRTTQYASNSSFYARTITLEDTSGRQSEVEEVFTPLTDSYDGLIRSKKLTGVLPNGEVLPVLENYYVSPSFIKNY